MRAGAREPAVWIALGLLASTAVLYFPAWPRPFEGWDDMGWIRDVQRRDTIARMFHPWLRTGNEGPDTSYVPIQSVFYWVMVRLFGAAPAPFRMLGTLAHALSGVLVFFVAQRLGVRRPWAAFAAAYFVIAASQAAVLTWVSAVVPHALVLPMLLGALLLWIRFLDRGSWWAWCGCLLLYAVSALMKESSLTLLVLLPGLSLLLHPRRQRVWHVAPLLLVFLAAVVVQVTKYQHGYVANRFGGVSLGVRLPLRVLDFMTLHVWPTNALLPLRLTLMGMVLAGLGFTVWHVRRQPRVALLVGWVVLWLLPFSFSNFWPILELNRYLYLSSAPVGVLVAVGLQRFSDWRRWPPLGLGVALLAVHATATWQRVRGY